MDWPTTLPPLSGLLLQGYQSQFQDVALRSEMDAGPGKVRPRFTAASEYITGEFVLNGTEYLVLYGFWRDDLRFGALSFNATHPETDAPCVVRFMEPPIRRPINGRKLWRVAVKLEILP